jgi:hypothetical protein
MSVFGETQPNSTPLGNGSFVKKQTFVFCVGKGES